MFSFIKQEKKIQSLRLALKQADTELEKLRKQNESMRQGMRHCVSCDYRIEAKQGNKSVPNLAQQN